MKEIFMACAVTAAVILTVLFVISFAARMIMKKTQINMIAPRTWHIKTGGGPACAHVYLLEGSERAMLIDTGFGMADLKKAVEALTDKPVFVLNTHGHFDHIGGNRQFAQVFLPEKDFEIYKLHNSRIFLKETLKGYFRDFHMPAWLLYLPFIHGVCKKIYAGNTGDTPDALKPNTDIDLGGRLLRVIPAPGHTMGSICIFDRENNLLFSADSGSSLGVLLGFDYSADVETYMNSIKNIREQINGETLIYPGHHKAPLSAPHFDKLIGATEKIISGELQGEPFRDAVCGGYKAEYKGIRIIYRKITGKKA